MEIKNLEGKKLFKGEITYKGVFNLFEKHIKSSQKILDVGAGNGFLISKLNEKFGKKAIGIDLKYESELVIKSDIAEIPFDSDTFDAIICTDVIEHLTDDILNKGLEEMYRVLKPNRHIIISTLLEEDLERLACVCPDCGKAFHINGHVQSFTREELIDRLKKANFVIEEINTMHFGCYSLYPFIFSLLKILHFENFLPEIFRKLFNKDVIIICSK